MIQGNKSTNPSEFRSVFKFITFKSRQKGFNDEHEVTDPETFNLQSIFF